MSDTSTNIACSFCGGRMEQGYTQLRVQIGVLELPNKDSHLTFVVPGESTSLNPLKAYRQGIEERPGDRKYIVRGRRCAKCARLELFAEDVIS